MLNPEFKFIIITVPKLKFRQWVEGDPSLAFDNELARRKNWHKELGTEDLKLIDNLGTTFQEFICDVYESTNRLMLPTQLADSVFSAPESVMVIFREYPFAKYQIGITIEELANQKMPRAALVKLVQ